MESFFQSLVTVEDILQTVRSYLPRLFAAALILVAGYLAAKIFASLLRRALERSRLDPTVTRFAVTLVVPLVMTYAAIAALSKLGVETTSLAAVIAAAGLAIGLALQGSLGSLASGVMLILRRPFTIGDYVEIAGTAGKVRGIALFATTLDTLDNKQVVVPNSSVAANVIVNYTANDTRRIDLVIGIGYDDDVEKAKGILERIVSEDERVLGEPAPQILVSELADSSVNFVVRPWVATSDYWTTRCELLEKIKLTFDAEGVSIPYPQHDVHLHQVEG